LAKLRAAKLLAGVRGAPPADVDAAVAAISAIGRIMQALPRVTDIDINPLMVHPKGQGVTALDALVVTD
jgi:succinyl-CoA synthetase beta subunit